MALKFLFSVAIVILLVILSFEVIIQKQEKISTLNPVNATLVEVARRQRALGNDKATISEIRIDYGGASMGLTEALSDYSVVIAELVENKSLASGPLNIHTLNRFRILETLTQKSYKHCPTCSPPTEIPQEMRRASEDEFFIDTTGGRLTIEGVEVTQPNNSLHFEKGIRYLMFVNLGPSQIARLAGGPTGVFTLDKNDHMRRLSTETTRLSREMEGHFQLNLPALKAELNR